LYKSFGIDYKTKQFAPALNRCHGKQKGGILTDLDAAQYNPAGDQKISGWPIFCKNKFES